MELTGKWPSQLSATEFETRFGAALGPAYTPAPNATPLLQMIKVTDGVGAVTYDTPTGAMEKHTTYGVAFLVDDGADDAYIERTLNQLADSCRKVADRPIQYVRARCRRETQTGAWCVQVRIQVPSY